MKRLPTLTIGIPACNEEANIAHVLMDLLEQKMEGFNLRKIIVVSDKSIDNTVKRARSVKDKRIEVLEFNQRKGKAYRLNQIMDKANTDILVVVDADILIKDKSFLRKIVSPIIAGKADLTSVPIIELKPESLFGDILKISMDFKRDIFENYNKGNNLYTCHGRARAFSKRLYKSIRFKGEISSLWFCEDGYSYLYTVFNNFKYIFVKNTAVYYKLPSGLRDHEKQSIRFYKSQQIFKKKFGEKFVRDENYLTPVFLIKNFLRYFLINPLIIVYLAVAGVLKIKSYMTDHTMDVWSMPVSSKKLRSNA